MEDKTLEAGKGPAEEHTFHAVEKDGEITAIWEMAGRHHIRTIDPKSEEGKRILDVYKPSEK